MSISLLYCSVNRTSSSVFQVILSCEVPSRAIRIKTNINCRIRMALDKIKSFVSRENCGMLVNHFSLQVSKLLMSFCWRLLNVDNG